MRLQRAFELAGLDVGAPLKGFGGRLHGAAAVPVAVQGLYALSCGAMFVMPMGTSPFTIVGSCALALWVFSGEFRRGVVNYLREPWFFPVLAIVVISWLGLIWTPDRKLGLSFAKKSYYWLYALAIASAAPVIRKKEHFIWAFLVGLSLNSLAAFLQFVHIVPRFSAWGAKGYTGFHSGYNTLGILLVLGILIASFYLKGVVRNQKKILAASLSIVFFCHLMILESRGAYFTFLILSPLVFHNVIGERRRWLTLFACVLSACILYSSPIVRERVNRAGLDVEYHLRNSKSAGDLGIQYSERLDRIFMWRWAISLFAEHPFLGVGTGGYKQAVLSRGGETAINHPHNNILHVAVSFGVTGLLLYGWLFWVLLRGGWLNRKEPIGFFVMSSGLVLLFGGVTDTHVLDSGGAFLLAVTTGFSAAVGQSEPSKETLERGSGEKENRTGNVPSFRVKLLYRYILSEIWPTLIVSLFVFIFIVLAARMLNIAEWVINHGVRLGDVGKMILYLLPWMVLFGLPAAMLMAVFVAFTRLSNDNEIMALKSSGISLYQMLPPVIAIALSVFLAALAISILIAPVGNRSFKELVFRIAQSKTDIGIKERIFSEPFNKVTFYVSSFSPEESLMKDLFLVDRRDPEMTNTIVAQKGQIVSDLKGKAIVIHLMNGTIFTTEKKSQAARTVQFSTYNVTIGIEDIMPSDSLRKRSTREMWVRELIGNLAEMEKKGKQYYGMAVELVERFSVPLAVLLMGLLGAPLGAQVKSLGRSLGVSVGMSVFIVYYLLMAGAKSLGEAGALSPFLGMWIPCLFLLVFGWLLMTKVQNEKPLLRWKK
jgi:lipopolysaccharide export system permease protein